MQSLADKRAITLGAKRAAYKEAHTILQTGKKWQRLVPGERRPDFERAARHVLYKALGRQTQALEPPMRVHNGLMHQHAPREARRIERYLRSGMLHPDVLHSFQSGRVTRKPRPVRLRTEPLRQDDQDVEHVVLDRLAQVHHPVHLNTRTGDYISRHEDAPEPQVVRSKPDAIGYSQEAGPEPIKVV